MPYDLQPTHLLPQTWATPLRGRLPGAPETHAERMARTDQQLEEERRDKAALRALDEAHEDWSRTDGAYLDNEPVREVLGLHTPVLCIIGAVCVICCNECAPPDDGDDWGQEWPCGTYRVVKELL